MSSDLPVGPLLDAAVTEKIRGPWDESRCRVCAWPVYPTTAEGCTRDNCSQRPVPASRADAPAPWSTDAGRAFGGIVPAMRERGWPFFTTSTLPDGTFHAAFGRYGDTPDADGSFSLQVLSNTAFAPTVAEAVCRAALAALDGRVTDLSESTEA